MIYVVIIWAILVLYIMQFVILKEDMDVKVKYRSIIKNKFIFWLFFIPILPWVFIISPKFIIYLFRLIIIIPKWIKENKDKF